METKSKIRRKKWSSDHLPKDNEVKVGNGLEGCKPSSLINITFKKLLCVPSSFATVVVICPLAYASRARQ